MISRVARGKKERELEGKKGLRLNDKKGSQLVKTATAENFSMPGL